MLALALLSGTACAGEGAPRGSEHRPLAALQRLTSVPLSGPQGADVGIVRDFDLTGDTLVLLDRTGRVVIAERRQAAWTVVAQFGRRGGGPGEFLAPTGVAATGGAVTVLDSDRLQSFGRDGALLVFRNLELPCVMLLPGVAHSASGVFVHGSCSRGGFATDTVKSVLAWSADTTNWHVVAEDVRYSRDGRVGHIFSTANALTPGADGLHLFGTGASNCVWLVTDRTVPPQAEQRCALVQAHYRADPPPQLRERLRSGAVGGTRMDWPPTLPVYVERTFADTAIVLVRPFSTDSVVLQLAGAPHADLAVAPLDGLIGCKAAGCLWVLEAADGVRLIVLDRPALGRLRRIAHG